MNFSRDIFEGWMSLTKDELHNLRKIYDVKGASGFNKEKLVEAILGKIETDSVSYPRIGWVTEELYSVICDLVQGVRFTVDELSEDAIDFLLLEGLIVDEFNIKTREMSFYMPELLRKVNASITMDNKELRKAVSVNSEIHGIAVNLINSYGLVELDEFVSMVCGYNKSRYIKDEVHEVLLLNILYQDLYFLININGDSYIILSELMYFDEVIDDIYYSKKSKSNIPYKSISHKEAKRKRSEFTVLNIKQQKLKKYLQTKGMSFLAVNHAIENMIKDIKISSVRGVMGKWVQTLGDALKLDSLDEMNELVDYVSEFNNNTPMFQNKGYTPNEISEIMQRNQNKKIIPFRKNF